MLQLDSHCITSKSKIQEAMHILIILLKDDRPPCEQAQASLLEDKRHMVLSLHHPSQEPLNSKKPSPLADE